MKKPRPTLRKISRAMSQCMATATLVYEVGGEIDTAFAVWTYVDMTEPSGSRHGMRAHDREDLRPAHFIPDGWARSGRIASSCDFSIASCERRRCWIS